MSLVLAYPPVGTADTVTLPSPEYGDTHRLDTNAIVRSTRGGETIAFKDSDWPDFETFVYKFRRVHLDVVNDLRTFLEDYAAEEISITDHLSNSRNGYILTPANDIITMVDTCHYDLTFEFLMTYDNEDFFKIEVETSPTLVTPHALATETSEEIIQESAP